MSAPLKVSAKKMMVLALGLSIVSAHALESVAKPSAATSKTSSSKEKGAARSVLSIGKDSSEKEVVEAFLSAVTRTDKDNSAKASFEEVANLMAVDEMAKRAFGEAGWPKFTPVEQKEVTSLFRRLIEIRFYPRWRRVFQNAQFSATSQSKQGEDSLIGGFLNSDGQKTALSFRLTRTPLGFRLVSMAVKDKDMLERTSVRLKRGLAKKGAAGLIAHLKKRTQEAQKDANYKPPLEELISGGK